LPWPEPDRRERQSDGDRAQQWGEDEQRVGDTGSQTAGYPEIHPTNVNPAPLLFFAIHALLLRFEQFLDGANVVAVLKRMGRERLPQGGWEFPFSCCCEFPPRRRIAIPNHADTVSPAGRHCQSPRKSHED